MNMQIFITIMLFLWQNHIFCKKYFSGSDLFAVRQRIPVEFFPQYRRGQIVIIAEKHRHPALIGQAAQYGDLSDGQLGVEQEFFGFKYPYPLEIFAE